MSGRAPGTNVVFDKKIRPFGPPASPGTGFRKSWTVRGTVLRAQPPTLTAPEMPSARSCGISNDPNGNDGPSVVFVKVTSVKPEATVATIELPPVVPAGETTLLTLYTAGVPILVSVTVTLVPTANVFPATTQ